jgi:cyclophilin family peptidyl-prolyl cis-trans isomerase
MRLPPQYALFGQAITGLDVVAEIDAIGTDSGTPRERVTIERVTIGESE